MTTNPILPPYRFSRPRQTEVARLRRQLELLAEYLNIDLDFLEALDRADRRGDPASWTECVAIGQDPTTGEQK